PAAGPPITTPASVADGLRGRVLLLPDVPPVNLTVHFWIDEQGAVERAETGPHRLSEADTGRVQAALLDLRFHPARSGQQAVRSELKLDLLVASATSL
ncbi:energy transducer TonB, partial [Pseudoduganella sp. OTU4001]|uniref:energy transducer TonB n=1 Tax=Pseudoduganella sp. OTU4001 TaxID=3043854 RepID=UPI00313CD4AE